MVRWTKLAMAGCALVVAVAGCSTKEPGSPTGTDTTTPGNGGATSSAESSGIAATSSTTQPANSNPCELLSSSDASTLGVGTGKRRDIQGVDTCQWTASGKFVLAVGYSKKGLAGLAGAEKVDIGKHEAMQVVGGQGAGCGITLGLSPSSTLIVTVTNASGPSSDACPQAVTIAKTIDPKLP